MVTASRIGPRVPTGMLLFFGCLVPSIDSNPQRIWDWRDPQVLVVIDWYRRWDKGT